MTAVYSTGSALPCCVSLYTPLLCLGVQSSVEILKEGFVQVQWCAFSRGTPYGVFYMLTLSSAGVVHFVACLRCRADVCACLRRLFLLFL